MELRHSEGELLLFREENSKWEIIGMVWILDREYQITVWSDNELTIY